MDFFLLLSAETSQGQVIQARGSRMHWRRPEKCTRVEPKFAEGNGAHALVEIINGLGRIIFGFFRDFGGSGF